jgi:hypothetical protein
MQRPRRGLIASEDEQEVAALKHELAKWFRIKRSQTCQDVSGNSS